MSISVLFCSKESQQPPKSPSSLVQPEFILVCVSLPPGETELCPALRSFFPTGARWLCGGISVQAGNSLQRSEQLHRLQDLSEQIR